MLKGYLDNSTVSVYTAGELFDQNQAYLEGRVHGLWATNMFSVGFMSLLHIVLNKMIDFPSWEGALISIPPIHNICDPGTYHSNFTTTAYCRDADGNTQKSVQCIQCPENMYTDQPDQYQCSACATGYYSFPGSSSCSSCYDMSDNYTSSTTIKSSCAAFIDDQAAQKRHLYMSIFIPIGIVLFLVALALLGRYLRKRWLTQRTLGSDEDWLLSFNELVKPPIHRWESSDKKNMPLPSQPELALTRSISHPVMAEHGLNPIEIHPITAEEYGGGTVILKQNHASIKDAHPLSRDFRFDPDLQQHVNHIHHQQEKGELQGVAKKRSSESPTSITTASSTSSCAMTTTAGIAGESLLIHKHNHKRSGATLAVQQHNKTDSKSMTGKPDFVHALGFQ